MTGGVVTGGVVVTVVVVVVVGPGGAPLALVVVDDDEELALRSFSDARTCTAGGALTVRTTSPVGDRFSL